MGNVTDTLLAVAGVLGGGSGGGGGGGEAVLVNKTVTANGTYASADDNADGYSEVTVNVPSKDYEASDWLDLSKPAGRIVSNVMPTAYSHQYALTKRANVTQAFFTDAVYVSAYMFNDCAGLRSFVGPKVDYLNADAFYNCTNMESIDVLGGQGFGTDMVRGSTKFNTFVIRGNSVTPISNINTFRGTPFASNGSGGTLYVPSALIAEYQNDTNWSTILGYPNNQIKAIEGSIYENQYADGTPIS